LAIALAVVVACWAAVFFVIQNLREANSRSECANNLKQIALAVHNYDQTNRSLPPAYITGKAGKPLMSWRVAVARFLYYECPENVDFGKSWNDPKNQVPTYCGRLFHCPDSLKRAGGPLTDYVAVVGRDTLWPGKTPGDLKQHPRAILAVEWPNSDIHWAEPRDISVAEFLAWFRAKPPRRGLWDWLSGRPAPGDGFHQGGLLYVDADGNVGQLPRDTDPETVRKLLAGRSQ
jgi:hypothetical protein